MPRANPIDRSILEQHAVRFWKHVERGASDKCWPWVGERGGLKGYGRFRVGTRSFIAHRVAYILTHGPLQHLGCHTCDNPPCCNPAHIFDGTYADNAVDALNKGRHKKTAKLTPDDVLELRKAHEQGTTLTQLGRKYGISPITARNIIIRQTWRHIP